MFDPRLEVSKVEESFRCPMSSGSSYLAYPCSGYQIESGYLSPFMLNSGQYGGNRQGNEQVASFLAPFREEPGASRDLALWPT